MNKLEKLKGVCVRGGDHGAEVIKGLVDAGAINISNFTGCRADSYYFFNKDNNVSWMNEPTGKEISLNELKEIVYGSEQPVKFTVYQRLRVLGFKKLKIYNKIFRDIYGHNPYQMRKQLDLKTYFVWDYSAPEKEDVQLVCDGVVVGQSSVEEVERIINLLK